MRAMHMTVAVVMLVSCPMVVRVIVTMLVATVVAVRATLWLEGFIDFNDMQMHGTQHVGQHMVGLDFQMIGLQFDGHMAVAQVVGRAGQIERRTVGCIESDARHRLRRSGHLQQGAIGTHQHIAAAHRGATRQKHTHAAPTAVGGFKPAFLTHIPIQADGVGALEQGFGQALALANEFGEMDHGDLNGVIKWGQIPIIEVKVRVPFNWNLTPIKNQNKK
jgi:hypothetical protein